MAFEGKSKVLFTVKETAKRDDPNSGWGIWLIAYYDKDGKPFGAKVVFGTFSTDPGTGDKRYYAKGMSLRDRDELKAKWKEVELLMKNPPPFEESGDLPHEDGPF